MNLFKLFIPKDNAQTVTELESWTVTWRVKEGWSNASLTYSKVFIKLEEVEEFKKQLKESAKFIGAWISVESHKN